MAKATKTKATTTTSAKAKSGSKSAKATPSAEANQKVSIKLKSVEMSHEAAAAPKPTPVPMTRAEALKITTARIEAAKANAKWTELFNKLKKAKPEAYSLRNAYVEETPILHKQLGWGYILSNKNDRLEVLFQDGIKYLISNYK